MDHTEKPNNGQQSWLFVFFCIFKKKSSLKIPLLHHAASFGLSVEGGRMVKEWDLEAVKNLRE
jgi:hypothetical protein